MKLHGERLVAATGDTIWAALLDPDTLKACIPGCEALEQTAPGSYRAVMVSKVGPIRARFAGAVTLDTSDLPAKCKLSGEGTGGVAGFVRGGALLKVDPVDAGSSRLSYEADVEIGGKIASLGDRLFRGVVERNIEQLLDELQARLTKTAN